MMSNHTKIHVPVGILYRWMYPTVNPTPAGMEGCSLVCPWDGRHPFLTRIIHQCRREVFETEARLGFSQVRPTEAYLQSVEEAEGEKPRRARGSDDVAGIHEESGLTR